MAWSTSAPSGITWQSWKETDGIKLNYLWFWIKARVGRGANNTIAVQVQLVANRFDYYTPGATITAHAEVSVNNGSTYSASSNYSAGPFAFRTDTVIKTVYYTGTANQGVVIKVRGYTPSDYTGVLSWSAPAYTTKYTISYNANGGSGAPASQTKTYGTALTLSSTKPTRDGYNFLGWSTSSTATTATYQPGGSYTANAAATLYAVWQLITYPVTFNGNGNDGGETAAQSKVYGTPLVLSQNGFTRTNYTFLYWNTAADGSGTTYAAGASYGANAALTLYAIWKKNNIPVYVNDNGTIRQVEKAYINDNGTIKECTVYLNVNDNIYIIQ